jgi:hypothetical protein
MLRIAARYALPLTIGWALTACSSSGTTPGGASNGADGASGSSDDSGSGSSSDDSGSTTGSQDAGGSHDGAAAGDGGSPHVDGGTAHDGGSHDGGSADGGDGGPRDIGSCCSAQTTPGCDDPNLEVCVCQKIPSCCTTAWTLGCALIVQQKYCQAGVRDCVCGTDAGQWDQTSCCSSDWNSLCDSVAMNKCGATTGCF